MRNSGRVALKRRREAEDGSRQFLVNIEQSTTRYTASQLQRCYLSRCSHCNLFDRREYCTGLQVAHSHNVLIGDSDYSYRSGQQHYQCIDSLSQRCPKSQSNPWSRESRLALQPVAMGLSTWVSLTGKTLRFHDLSQHLVATTINTPRSTTLPLTRPKLRKCVSSPT